VKKRFQKVYIEITNRCNLSCDFCPKNIRKLQDMAPKNFNYILNEIKEYTDLIYLHVKGEPLIHPNIKEIFEICDKNNIMVNLTTNGTLIKKNVEILSNAKSLRQINISIHSAVQNKKEEKEIIKYMYNIFECVERLKHNTIISYRLWNVNSINENEHNKLTLEMLGNRYNVPMLYNIAKENNFVKLDDNVYLNQDIEFKWPNINSQEISCTGMCLGLKNQIAILVNGDVIPCCLDENANILLGNIFENTVEEIIYSDRARKIIEGFNQNKLEEKLCRTCGFRKKFDK